ncbi:T9SS-dependent choice-of-anchor J family protein [Flavivirga spongiicola]|uniref:T9SS type A sorting domain-containing protein n=1 Tax=Flavivirga spongiicola TaxID=421621 RepID=A0ABU7XNX4_9FLAO|nr:T9SS type A sorting domain-containing protein [Flavivirga sp. MEBiC05379]MDO5981787.1 T9SS type A sorting domain-containing protein [Flavivirga sp. MEBiC05379]
MNIFITNPKLLLISIILSAPYYTFGQNKIESSCGTVTTSESIDYINSIKPQIKKYEKAFAFSKSGKSNTHRIVNSIPIKAHIIRSSNGSDGLSTSDLNNAIENLNDIYAGAYMEFFLCDSIDYIDDDVFCHFKKGNESDLKEAYYTPGLINIYFVNQLLNSSDASICGYSNNVGRDNDIIVMKNSCATNGSSLAHELGHFFSLTHTHGPDNNKMTTELVDGSNCDTDGDGICDTPADPILSNSNVNSFCEFIGIETDANGHTFNPDTGNLMSYSRKSCRNHFTDQQLARMYAFYHTTKNYLACPSFNANFSVDTSITCEETLTVNFKNNCSNITNWQWDIDSDGIIDYTNQNPSHTYDTGIYDVTLTVSNKSKTIKKTFSKFIKVGTEINPIEENFENFEIAGDHGWTTIDTSKSGYNWYSNIGQTATDGTGPLSNNKSDDIIGKYIYAEASGANPGDVAEFISPCINITSSNTALEFSYHMFGKNIGELHIDIKTDSGYINDVIPALHGNQQSNQDDAFLKKLIDLSSYENETIKVRFRAIRGASWDGDIAIDNILIKHIEEEQDSSKTLSNITAYPNPITNASLYIKSRNTEAVLNYQISNLVGQVFLSGTLTNQPINVSSLSSGTYFLTIHSENSRIVKKIIK